MGVRVLVCGGRNFDNRDFVWKTLCDLDVQRGPIDCVVHGCASGADDEGMIWAQTLGRKHAPFKADWSDITAPGAVIKVSRSGKRYNAAAGPWRNQRMIDDGKPDFVVAFPGGKGTRDMVLRAKRASIEVITANPPKGA